MRKSTVRIASLSSKNRTVDLQNATQDRSPAPTKWQHMINYHPSSRMDPAPAANNVPAWHSNEEQYKERHI